MIWTDFHFFSQSLGIQTAVYVLLPEHAQMEALGGAKFRDRVTMRNWSTVQKLQALAGG